MPKIKKKKCAEPIDERPTGPLFTVQRFITPVDVKDDRVQKVVAREGEGPFMVHRVENEIGSGNLPFTVKVTFSGDRGGLYTLPGHLFQLYQ